MISVSGVSTRTSEFQDIFPSNVAIDRKEYFQFKQSWAIGVFSSDDKNIAKFLVKFNGQHTTLFPEHVKRKERSKRKG